MRNLFALLAGLMFGLGLYLSGMSNPAKVLAFLDVAGVWDPSLAFVMIGAIAIASIPYYVARRRRLSLLGAPINLPAQRAIERRLVFGSLAFGAGWGIAGLCPGPALALLLTGRWPVVLFVVSMLAGMLIFESIERRARKPT